MSRSLARVEEALAALGLAANIVEAGFCRTGKWFAVDHEGVVPDLVTTAKLLSSSLQSPVSIMTNNNNNDGPRRRINPSVCTG